MKWRAGFIAAMVAAVFVTPLETQAQSCALTQAQQTALRAEHVFGGQPAPGAVLVRRGYVTQYDAAHQVPRWSAWRVEPGYLDPPDRDVDQWGRFRTDPDIANAVTDSDYVGVGAIDMARGHIVPYFVGGGDRDHDGLTAATDDGELLDPYDACTMYEINYMSNIAPQFQTTFNGGDGLWYQLETRIRLELVGGPFGTPIYIIAGTVFGNEEIETVGAGDIPVPHMFFQILITPSGVVPFLFVHTVAVGSHGCPLTAELPECIVAIADIEAITGLDFFNAFGAEFEAVLQTPDGRAVWQVLTGE